MMKVKNSQAFDELDLKKEKKIEDDNIKSKIIKKSKNEAV